MHNHHTAEFMARARQADLLREAQAARLARAARDGVPPRRQRPARLSMLARVRHQLASAAASIGLLLGYRARKRAGYRR